MVRNGNLTTTQLNRRERTHTVGSVVIQKRRKSTDFKFKIWKIGRVCVCVCCYASSARLVAVQPQHRLHEEVRQTDAVDDLLALLSLHSVQLDGQHAPVELVHLPAQMLQLLGG